MSRFDTVYLEVEDSTSVGVFELSIGLQVRGDLDKTFLMGERGQYITEVFNQTGALGDISSDLDRRAGFWLDGGAGNVGTTISFETGLEDVTWGDGSGGDGPTNVTARDASGADVKPLSRYHVLELWLARTRTDSQNPARLFFGEYATGKYHSEAGAFNQALPVAVTNFQPEMPDPNGEPPAVLKGTIDVSRIMLLSDISAPTWMESSNIGTFTEGAVEELSGVIPDE